MDIDELWECIDKKNGPLMPRMKTPCWPWIGKLRDGYGRVWFDGRHQTVHRIVWIERHGDPGEMMVLHRCHFRPCVRHLYLGTNADNMRDMIAAGRQGVRHIENIGGRAPRGETHHNAKLSDAEIVRLREDRDGGMRLVDLAKKYGVSVGGAGKIAAGQLRFVR